MQNAYNANHLVCQYTSFNIISPMHRIISRSPACRPRIPVRDVLAFMSANFPHQDLTRPANSPRTSYLKPSMIQARCLRRTGHRFTTSSIALTSSPRPNQKVLPPTHKAFCPHIGCVLTDSRSFIPLWLERRRDMKLLRTP